MKVKEIAVLKLGGVLSKHKMEEGESILHLSYCWDQIVLAYTIKCIHVTCIMHAALSSCSSDLGNLIVHVRGIIDAFSKAKAAKLIRELVDMFLVVGATTEQEVWLN